jgi:hypothetical protein
MDERRKEGTRGVNRPALNGVFWRENVFLKVMQAIYAPMIMMVMET